MTDKLKGKYFDLMAKRKALLFKGGHEEEAQKMLELAQRVLKSGKVSDDEVIAASYI